MAYSRQQLQDLWIQAGGNPTAAPMAAAVALAESGGKPDATNANPNGSIDRGLWQINSVHGALSTFDPIANAKAAVSISKNGTNWRPWCTAWSTGRCSGTFLGAGSPVLKFLGGGVTSPDSTNQSQAQQSFTPTFENTTLPTAVNPQAWADAFLKPVAVWSWFFLMYVSGMILIVVGIVLLIWDTNFRGWATAQVKQKWNMLTAGKERREIVNE